MKRKRIGYRGNHRLLNFSDRPVLWVFHTAEHMLQAIKSTSYQGWKDVCAEPDPWGAKREGNKVPLRSDWEEVKLAAATAVIILKCIYHPRLRRELLATERAYLYEDRKDPEWGIGPGGNGRNLQGKAMMLARHVLRISAKQATTKETK